MRILCKACSLCLSRGKIDKKLEVILLMELLSFLGIVADITGILSFVLTIVLLIKSEAIRKELDAQRNEYKRDQKKIKVYMMALRDNVFLDQMLDLKIVSNIRTQLYSFEQKFARLLTRSDKQHLSNTLKILDGSLESIDKGELCRELDYFIARLERQELE